MSKTEKCTFRMGGGLKKTESEPQCPKPKKDFCIVVETVVHLMEDKTKLFLHFGRNFCPLDGMAKGI